MDITKQEKHRSGALKQSNKQHKTGRHRSKSAVNNDVKGKQNVIKMSRRIKRDLQKDARRNQLSQIRKKKREEVLAKKRNFGGVSSAPILICLVPLQNDIDTDKVMSVLKTNMNEIAHISISPCGITHIGVPRLKQRFSIVISPMNDVLATLDIAKVATTILFVTQAYNDTEREIIDDWGKEVIMSCLAQGLPATAIAVHDIQKLHIKKRQEYKQSVQHAISKYLPEEKILELDTATDCLNMLRRIGSQKQRNVFYKNVRPHLLAEEIYFECQEKSNLGTLTVKGYLQGSPLSANDLVHITGFGNYQISCIECTRSNDPYPIDKGEKRLLNNKIEIDRNTRIVQTADPEKQESLESMCISDPMDDEQVLHIEKQQAKSVAGKKIIKVVPKGTSEYQAAWIPDEDGESLSIYSDNESEDNMSVHQARSESDSNEDMEDDEEFETITISEVAMDEKRYDQDFDMNQEKQAMENFQEAKMDAQFPDEVDITESMSAKIRFRKYRGLESFRTSPWDPKENLPDDYSRIIEFADYDRTRKRIYKEREENMDIMPGDYITLCLINVSSEVIKMVQPLIVTGLLKYEQKISVLNIVLKRSSNYTLPIKSKQELVFQYGFRRFKACPIFSQHTNGTKHKYERYFQPDTTVVASMYAPVTFSPCPVLCYIKNKNGELELIATGSVLSCNPNRIILKRVVLTGEPYKVNKRSVVVRFMFFNREDIEWFKPIQLRTQYGRKGHIKEPLGTHGHMKCIFNGQLKSQDRIFMNLYKRVFPKLTYKPFQSTQLSLQPEEMQIE